MVKHLIEGMDIGKVALIGHRRPFGGPQYLVDAQAQQIFGMVGIGVVHDQDVGPFVADQALQRIVHLHEARILGKPKIVEQLRAQIMSWVEEGAVVNGRNRSSCVEAPAISRCQKPSSKPTLFNE